MGNGECGMGNGECGNAGSWRGLMSVLVSLYQAQTALPETGPCFVEYKYVYRISTLDEEKVDDG